MNLWRKILNTFSLGRRGGSCHEEGMHLGSNSLRKVGIVGSPNVGKSVIFNRFTAGYIALADGQVRLTDTGRPVARNVVRRHRLVERLLVDVLGTRDVLIHEKVCKLNTCFTGAGREHLHFVRLLQDMPLR